MGGRALLDQFVVGILTPDANGVPQPTIDYQYPASESPDKFKALLPFCFPDVRSEQAVTSLDAEAFTFTLTESDGTRRFGFCQHLLPPGDGPRYPITLCLMSYLPWYDVLMQIISIFNDRRNQDINEAAAFLVKVAQSAVPHPGGLLTIKVRPLADGFTMYQFIAPLQEPAFPICDVSYLDLLASLGVSNLLKLFSAILCEKRVIVCSQYLSLISSCIHGLACLLAPFTWQHVFIPILPRDMLSYASAPMPFIVGMPLAYIDELNSLPLEEVVFVDLDNGNLTRAGNFDESVPSPTIPPGLASKLKRRIEREVTGYKKTNTLDLEAFENCFYRFFISLFGHYRAHLQPGTKDGFDFDGFLAQSDKKTHKFLKIFRHSQMFNMFLSSRLSPAEGTDPYDNKFDNFLAKLSEGMDVADVIKGAKGPRLRKRLGAFIDRVRSSSSSPSQSGGSNQSPATASGGLTRHGSAGNLGRSPLSPALATQGSARSTGGTGGTGGGGGGGGGYVPPEIPSASAPGIAPPPALQAELGSVLQHRRDGRGAQSAMGHDTDPSAGGNGVWGLLRPEDIRQSEPGARQSTEPPPLPPKPRSYTVSSAPSTPHHAAAGADSSTGPNVPVADLISFSPAVTTTHLRSSSQPTFDLMSEDDLRSETSLAEREVCLTDRCYMKTAPPKPRRPDHFTFVAVADSEAGDDDGDGDGDGNDDLLDLGISPSVPMTSTDSQVRKGESLIDWGESTSLSAPVAPTHVAPADPFGLFAPASTPQTKMVSSTFPFSGITGTTTPTTTASNNTTTTTTTTTTTAAATTTGMSTPHAAIVVPPPPRDLGGTRPQVDPFTAVARRKPAVPPKPHAGTSASAVSPTGSNSGISGGAASTQWQVNPHGSSTSKYRGAFSSTPDHQARDIGGGTVQPSRSGVGYRNTQTPPQVPVKPSSSNTIGGKGKGKGKGNMLSEFDPWAPS